MANSQDNMSRIKRASPVGTSTFVGLRALDVWIQYGILAQGLADPLLNRLGISHIPATTAPIVALGLPLKPLVILAMAAGTAIKQIYWILAIAQEEMPVANALPIGFFNTLFNSANSIISLTTAASYLTPRFLSAVSGQNELSPLFIISTILYIVGIVIETASEVQRLQFKKDSKNEGKPFTGGLWSLARHINYGAYTVMRSGYALASGGPIWGSVIFSFFAVDFVRRGVPVLDEYCTKRYGASWAEFKKKTPYVLFPGIY
ncbi:hypothetical protein BGZ60DRAFT_523340 [Tricladium varicosporioides]|nr:hypothetical protein BGZ60DRAFT_523340 [Hymenoscyphus varicosporioides]